MPTIPLAASLKRRIHRSIALAQDVLVAQAYDSFPDCVLHGGTAIWRCYGGGRFSDDVDAYLPTYSGPSAAGFRRGLAAKGMVEQKFKATANTVFGSFALAGAGVSFEGALRKPPGGMTIPYQLLSGGYMLVIALPPDELVVEKTLAYAERAKARDLYDAFFLLGKVEDSRKVARRISPLLADLRLPSDEPQLKATILTGAVPSAEEMIEGIRAWARRST